MGHQRKISPALRMEIFKRDGFTCQYCGAQAPDARLVIDHVDPVALGGKDDPHNLLTTCTSCNIGKTDVPLSAVRLPKREKSPAKPAVLAPVLGRNQRGPKPTGKRRWDIYLQPSAMAKLWLHGYGNASDAVERLTETLPEPTPDELAAFETELERRKRPRRSSQSQP